MPRSHTPWLFSALLLAACPSGSLDLVSPKLVVSVGAGELKDTSVAFGEVVVTNRATRVVTLANVGARSLEIEGVDREGEGTFQHSPIPAAIERGQQVNVVVSFEPNAVGKALGAIVLYTNELGRGTVRVDLSGDGVDPGVRVCAGPLDLVDENCRPGTRRVDFGEAIEKHARPDRRVQITAVGGSRVEVASANVRLTKPLPKCAAGDAFTIVDDPGAFALAPGETRELAIHFAPPCAGDYEAELLLETSDPRNPAPKVSLSGSGEHDCTAMSDTYFPEIVFDNKVDILFILDDSASMQYIQATVKQYAASFIGQLTDPLRPVDFHIGVTTTDLTRADRRGRLVSRTVNAGAFSETIRVINKHSLATAPNPADRGPVRAFQLLMEAIDTSGSPDEFGFATAGAALTFGGSFNYRYGTGTYTIPGAADISTSADPTKPNGFLRPDARLAIIILSDEDDATGQVANMASYVKGLQGLVGRAGVPQGFKQRVLDKPEDLQIFAVVDPSATSAQGCPAPSTWQPGDPPYSYSSGTPNYHAGVAAFGPSARIVSLCSNFPATLTDIATSLSKPQCTFEVKGGIVTPEEGADLCIQGGRCFLPSEYTIAPPSAAQPNGSVTIKDSACPNLQTVLQFDFVSCLRSADQDGDTVPNVMDLCPVNADPGQDDGDSDGTGDACE